jgi:transcriptional regulator GlxA family with amidase domain
MAIESMTPQTPEAPCAELLPKLHKDRLVHRAMQMMHQTLETPLSVPKLAAALAYPTKTLVCYDPRFSFKPP